VKIRPTVIEIYTTNATAVCNAEFIIILTGVAGVARPGPLLQSAKSATPLNIKLSVARRARLAQMMARRCRYQSSSSSDGRRPGSSQPAVSKLRLRAVMAVV